MEYAQYTQEDEARRTELNIRLKETITSLLQTGAQVRRVLTRSPFGEKDNTDDFRILSRDVEKVIELLAENIGSTEIARAIAKRALAPHLERILLATKSAQTKETINSRRDYVSGEITKYQQGHQVAFGSMSISKADSQIQDYQPRNVEAILNDFCDTVLTENKTA